jgi:hypothetical protein
VDFEVRSFAENEWVATRRRHLSSKKNIELDTVEKK